MPIVYTNYDFSVEMWLGASVSKLKEKIKSEIQHNFDANNLRLFKVDMPTGDMSNILNDIAALHLPKEWTPHGS